VGPCRRGARGARASSTKTGSTIRSARHSSYRRGARSAGHSRRPSTPGPGAQDILGIGQGTEEPVREIEQLTPLAHERVHGRIGRAVSLFGWGGHGGSSSLGPDLPSQFDEMAHRTVRSMRRLTFRWAVSSYC